MAVQPRWVWGRRKEVLCSSRKAGCVQEAVQGGEELMKNHSLCTSLRKKDQTLLLSSWVRGGHPSASGAGSGRFLKLSKWGGPYTGATG